MNSRTWKIFISVCAIAALAHCNTTDRTRRGYLRANAARLGAPPRPVIVIAGFGVTRLVDPVTGRHIWGTPRAMWQRTFPDALKVEDRIVIAGDCVPTAIRVLARCDGHQGIAADPSVHRAIIRALRE